jgi:dTDP-glucose pyrophosphorylase
MVQGVGVIPTDNPEDIRSSYSVEHDERSLIQRVVEKPRQLPNDLCGTGFYFFSHTVFEAIPRTPPSPLKGQVEITDVLQQMVDEGHPLYAARLEGRYLNITRPGDLARAQAIVG